MDSTVPEFYHFFVSHLLQAFILSSFHSLTLTYSSSHHASTFMLFQTLFLRLFATQLSGNRFVFTYHLEYDWAGNQPRFWFRSTRPSGAWIHTTSDTTAGLETLTNTSLNTHQYDISLTNPSVSVLSSIIPKKYLPLNKCYNYTAMADSTHPCSSSSSHLFRPIYHFVSYFRPSVTPLFHYTYISASFPISLSQPFLLKVRLSRLYTITTLQH